MVLLKYREWVVDHDYLDLKRCQAGLSRSALGRLAGVDPSTATLACTGQHTSTRTVNKLCRVINLDPGKIIVSAKQLAIREGVRRQMAAGKEPEGRNPDPMTRAEDQSPWPEVDLTTKNLNLP